MFPWRVPAEASRPLLNRKVMEVCETARQVIKSNRRDNLRGGRASGEDPGHLLLNRLKVAALLGLLDGRYEVSEADWQIAGRIIDLSEATRRGMETILRSKAHQAGVTRAEAEAHKAVIVEQRTTDAQVERAATNVARHIHRNHSSPGKSPCEPRCLTRGLSKSAREVEADAVEIAVTRGWVAQDGEDSKGRPLVSPARRPPLVVCDAGQVCRRCRRVGADKHPATSRVHRGRKTLSLSMSCNDKQCQPGAKRKARRNSRCRALSAPTAPTSRRADKYRPAHHHREGPCT